MRQSDLVLVAKLIYAGGYASRAALAEKTGLAPSYISTLVSRLEGRQIVLEGGRAPSKGGRRRVLLYINPEIAHLIGIDIGTFSARVVVTDFSGGILSLKELPDDVPKTKDRVLDWIDSEVASAMRRDPAIKGIGIAASGVIERKTGTILFWPKSASWRDVPLKHIFEERHGLPTMLEDSVRTMAFAEQRLGVAKRLADFVFVNVGMGIGSAFFWGGDVYLGHRGLAGELGHTTIDEKGEPCSCGNRGCMEVYASGSAIINRARTSLQQGVASSLQGAEGQQPEGPSLGAIASAAKSGDRLSQRILGEAGTHLGTGLATIVNLLNPQVIILGGGVLRLAKDFLLEPMYFSLRERAFPESTRELNLMISGLGYEAAAVGAAIMTGEHLLKSLSEPIPNSASRGIISDFPLKTDGRDAKLPIH